jgi:hypothetical protein
VIQGGVFEPAAEFMDEEAFHFRRHHLSNPNPFPQKTFSYSSAIKGKYAYH